MGLKVAIINGKTPSSGVGGVSDADHLNLANNFLNKGIVGVNDLALSIVTGMSIQIATGNVYVPNAGGTVLYPISLDTIQSLTVPSNSTGNDRYSTLVIKLDLVTTPNNLADNVATLVWVNGSSSSSPVAPTDSALQTAVGASNGFIRLFDIYVANSASSISGGNVVDRRTLAYFNGLSKSDGWTKTNDTLVYFSSNQFKITGIDRTSVYTKGTRVMFTNNGITYYGTVGSSSFSTDTTVTLIPNADFSINNSAISNPSYSYQVNPQGYPGWFNFSGETWTGFSSPPSGGVYQFYVVGNMITVNIQRGSGVSNSSSLSVTLPIAASQQMFPQGQGFDNSSYPSGSSPAYIIGGTSTLLCYKNTNQTSNWTSSGNKGWEGTFAYPF